MLPSLGNKGSLKNQPSLYQEKLIRSNTPKHCNKKQKVEQGFKRATSHRTNSDLTGNQECCAIY